MADLLHMQTGRYYLQPVDVSSDIVHIYTKLPAPDVIQQAVRRHKKNGGTCNPIFRIRKYEMARNSRILWVCIGAAAALLVVWALSSLKTPEPAADTASTGTAAPSETASDSASPARPGTPAPPDTPAPRDMDPGKLSPAEARRMIEDRARGAVTVLGAGDMEQFSSVVHPVKGVRFSPYAHVIPGEDLVFPKEQVAILWNDSKKYLWGSFDGSGDSIIMTFRDYHKRFIYNYKYARAERVAYNDKLLGFGNTLNNIREIYPQGLIVEYNFPGQDPKYGGMDWGSLWLVFERENSGWYVVGVVHDEWTS